MAVLPVWDEQEHAEVVDKPLKGEGLRMLIAALEENCELAKFGAASSRKMAAYLKQHNPDNAAAQELPADYADPGVRVYTGIIQALKEMIAHPKAIEHGLDFRDFKTLVSKMVVDPEFDPKEIVKKMETRFEEAAEDPQGARHAKHITADIMEEATAASVLGLFSASLAVQEGKEKEYARLIASTNQHLGQLMGAAASQAQASQDRNAISASLFGSVTLELLLLKELHMAHERGNSLVPLYTQVILGHRGDGKQVGGMIDLTRDAMAAALNIDRNTHAGETQLMTWEKRALANLAQVYEMEPIYPPDQKGPNVTH